MSPAPPGALLDLLFDEPELGRCLIAPDGTVLRVNAAWQRLTGLEQKDVVGKDLAGLVPETRAATLALQARARAGQRVEIPRHTERIAGRETEWEGRIEPVQLAEGTGLLLTQRDLSDEEHAARPGAAGPFRELTALKRAEQELRESEELFRSALDNHPDAFALYDEEGRLRYANKAVTAALGRPAAELFGLRMADLMPQAAWAHYLPPLRRAYETAETQQFDAEALFPDGTARFRHAAYVPIKGPTGKVTKVLAVGHDVTAERRLSEELRQQSEVLKEADRRKTEFLAVLSHELRNPLAPIRNCLFLLDRSLPGNHSARRVLAVLQRQTEHLTRLVDDLLDVTRISRGKIELQRARLDARDVARRTCDDVRIVFAQRGVGITYTQTPEPMWVDADGIRLAQMVGNLLNNALKFTQPGGQVDVIVGQHGGRCEIRVRDTGLGIEAAELDRIFDPFMQTERTQKRVQGGLGIGLTLVRELALLHEGKVHALSAGPDQGAEFVLALPLVVAPADAADPAAAGPQVATLSILIVDDNEDAGATLADLLALAGHSVRVVTTGQAGIDAASVHPPDALICDIGLPDRSGYEVIRTLRATPSASRVFAISLTGYAQPRDRQRAVEAGFDAHLAKPPSFDELNELLSTAAQKRGPTRPAPR